MSDYILLKNVRVSFPSLFEPEVFNGQVGKHAVTLLLDDETNAAGIASLEKAVAEVTKNSFKSKALSPDRVCLKEISGSDRDEYQDYAYKIKASSKDAPLVLDVQAKQVMDPAKNPIYSGCYANVKVSLWAQDNKQGGKRINCQLVAIQFAADGEGFALGHISKDQAMEGFAPVGDTNPDDVFA